MELSQVSTRRPVFKTVLIGEGGVGKTSLAIRYTEDRFDQQMKMTIGVNFATKKVNVAGTDITLLLWDLGGQPRFQDVVMDYFKGSKLAIAVYEVSRPFTMFRLEDWIARLHGSVPDCDIFLVANKIDERIEGMGVTPEEARDFAAKYDARTFEVSAKTGDSVNAMFQAAAQHLVSKHI
ncbi:MAG: GTP-binding protein [Candidatus Thorarchaeota archaeon]|nr:MAG: GTP-binding protein [Candidatus Thorarchaeota archaeon]